MNEIELSSFGQRFVGASGILELMDDIGKALSAGNMIMMGGGNPSHIPAVQQVFRDQMGRLLDSESDFEGLIGNYDGPAGNTAFIAALVEMFREEFGWEISAENIALTNGSQTAFFQLFNMFGGKYADGSFRRILLPLAPEYIGYEDVGIDPGIFVSYKPTIEFLENRFFKYHVDFDAIEVDESISAICVSRPTTRPAMLLTEEEISELSAIAKERGIPLIIDNAYGTPFPGIIFTDAEARWEPHIVMCMSLSKLGLPGARTGIVIAHKKIIQAMTGMNAVTSLAPGSLGAGLAINAVKSREILQISSDLIQPHYRRLMEQTVRRLHEALDGTDYYIHKPEGAIFLWLWFRDLPISCYELYERLKARGVVIVPGNYFFPGLPDEWQHRHECIRMNYAGDAEDTRRGVAILAEEVKRAYSFS